MRRAARPLSYSTELKHVIALTKPHTSGELIDLLGDVDKIDGKKVIVKPKAWYVFKQN
jgi:hypothetical protein